MLKPEISVVMSTTGETPFFNECIKSVLNQTHQNWELLIYFDGCRPSKMQLEWFSDPRVQVFGGDTRLGLPAALNKLVRLSKGELIARMDDDDTMMPDRLARQCDQFSESKIDVCCSAALKRFPSGQLGSVIPNKFSVTPAKLLLANPIVHPTVMFTRRWSLNNPYDERMLKAQDWALWLKTSGHCRFKFIESPLLEYRTPEMQSREKQLETYRHQLLYLSNYCDSRIAMHLRIIGLIVIGVKFMVARIMIWYR